MNVVENGLTWDIFDSLRRYANMPQYDKDDIIEALKNTLFSVVVYDAEKPIAIGRVVGDGRICFFIKDVVVDPFYRDKAIGTLVVNSLLNYIEAKGCKNPYIGLMAMPNTESFYERFGFIRRPNDSFGSGMLCLDRKKV